MKLPALLTTCLAMLLAGAAAPAADRPNIIYILCDDLGYGDVRCLNAESKIPTPNFDRIAAAGLKFTDAHSSSAVCTPTRYGILTGRYNWRSRLQEGVLGGLSPHLIEPGRLTVASLLKQHGYATACIGKWHLGMDWPVKEPGYQPTDSIEKGPEGWKIDWLQPIRNGPLSVGFDYFYGISASLDMIPYTYLENDRVTVEPTLGLAFPMVPGEAGETRRGPGAPEFEAQQVLPELGRKAVEYVRRQTAAQPFFLYLPLTSPHTPIAPTTEWRGKSGLNAYADFVMQTDAVIGAVVDALKAQGLDQNTLLIVTSDNGCSPKAGFPQLAAKGHHPSGPLRGYKADIFDGGHRVPFLVQWPAKVAAGGTSQELTCLTDLLATCAEIVGAPLPPNAGEDSVSLLPALLGRTKQPLREAVVHHSIRGNFAIRQGAWKLALCRDSGGWSEPRPGTRAAEGLPEVQLFHLDEDLAEKMNVAAEHPAVVQKLEALLAKYVTEGRSTPGPRQQNDVPVQIRKADLPVRRANGGAKAER